MSPHLSDVPAVCLLKLAWWNRLPRLVNSHRRFPPPAWTRTWSYVIWKTNIRIIFQWQAKVKINKKDNRSVGLLKKKKKKEFLLGKVCENECAFLRQQFVLLHSELLQELTAGDSENGLKQTATKHMGGFIARQTVVTLGHMAVAQPPGRHRKKVILWPPKLASNREI